MQRLGVGREPLSRDRVLEAALEIADREGLDALSMRRLGRALGVEAMSLYTHVAGKEGVLDGLVELVLSRVDPPPADVTAWDDRARHMARSFRMIAHRHPNVMPLIVSRRVHTPASLVPVEMALGVLADAGFDGPGVIHAYQAVTAYLLGFVLFELGGIFAGPDHVEELLADIHGLAPGQFPNILRFAPPLLPCDADTEFEQGLDIVLAGIARRLEGSGSRSA